MARRSLKPQLNQIRTWVRQGRTDAWVAHQLEVSVPDIANFKRDHELAPDDDGDAASGGFEDDLDLRAEDDALVAAELDAEVDEPEPEPEPAPDETAEPIDEEDGGAAPGSEGDEDEQPRRRRRRRGGRGRKRGSGRGGGALEGTFDHGEDGYGLWLDPAVQEDGVYAEHWAGHRTVTVTVEADRIVIRRAGEGAEEDDSQ